MYWILANYKIVAMGTSQPGNHVMMLEETNPDGVASIESQVEVCFIPLTWMLKGAMGKI